MKNENKFIFSGDDATNNITNIESSRDDSISDIENFNDENSPYETDNETITLPENREERNKEAIQDTLNEGGTEILKKMGVPEGVANKAIKKGTFADRSPVNKFLKNKAMNTMAKSPGGDMLGGLKGKNGNSLPKNASSGSNNPIADKENGLNSLTNNLAGGLKSALGNKLGSLGNKEGTNVNPAEIVNKIKKYKAILPMIPIALKVFAILVIVIAIVMIPVTFSEQIKDVGQKFSNLWKYWKFETDKEIIESFYDEIDNVVAEMKDIGVEANKDLLTSSVVYGAYLMEDYAQDYDEINEFLVDKYAEITNYIYSVANQMIYIDALIHYNTYTVTDTIIVTEKDKNGKIIEKEKEIKTEYCYGQEIDENRKENLKEYADNYTEEKNTTDTKKICANISYSEDLEKFESFLRYIYIPTATYGVEIKDEFDILVERLKSLFNKKPVTGTFDEAYGREYYNIKKEDIGTKYNGYTVLTSKQQRETNNTISTILALAKTNIALSDKYYIKGATTLPVDLSSGQSITDRIKGDLSDYGNRTDPITLEPSFHFGVDITHITNSDPIYSVADGVVISAIPRGIGSYGNNVTIGHDINNDNKYDYYTLYAHLSSVKVSTGDIVNNGQVIGIMGSTGKSTGTHLHFEIRNESNTPIDPLPYLKNIEENKSELTSNVVTSLTDEEVKKHRETLNNKISSTLGTRRAVINSSKYLGENFNGLPYFCGGYSTSLIDSNWYKNQTITDNSCLNAGKTSSYGLDISGFVSWVLGISGITDRTHYSIAELSELGKKIELTNPSVQTGDLVWKEGNIGVIIDIDDTNLVVVYMNSINGLTIDTISRNYNGLFSKAILMEY